MSAPAAAQRHRTRFRPLVAFAGLAIAAAAADHPFLEVTWRAGDDLAPPEPIAATWREFAGSAEDGWLHALGLAASPDALAIIGGRIARGPAIALRWSGPLGDGGAALGAAVGRWGEPYHVEIGAHGAAMRCDGLPPPPMVGAEPGWRMTLDGASVADELATMRSALPPPRRTSIVDAVRGWRITAAIEPARPEPTGWIDTGIAGGWLRAIDPTLLARIPDDATAVAAVGIDGAALAPLVVAAGAALSPLADATRSLWPDPAVPLPDLASAATGDWVLAWSGDGRFLLRAPRSPATDRLLARVLDRAEQPLPRDAAPVHVHDVFWLAGDAHEWLFADSDDRIAAWRADAPHAAAWARLGGPPPPATAIYGACDAPTSAALVALVDDDVARQWPIRLLPHGTDALLKDLGIRPPATPTWERRVAGLSLTTPSRVTALAGAPTLRLQTAGPILPWLPIGWALGWASAQVQDQQGRVHLRDELAGRRARGLPAVPDDLVEDAAAGPAVDAVRTALDALAAVDPSGWHHWGTLFDRGASVDRVTMDAATAAVVDRVAAATRSLDACDPHDVLVQLLACDRRDPAGLGPAGCRSWTALIRKLQSIGKNAAAADDARGLDLLDRAWRLCDRPLSVVDGLIAARCAEARDAAYAVAAAHGWAPAERVATWLAEAERDRFADAVEGEAVMSVGWAAQGWLAGRIPSVDAKPEAMSPGLIGDRLLRAASADDLVRMMRFDDDLAHGASDVGRALREVTSPIVGMLQPAVMLERNAEREARLRGALIRCAVRCRALAPAGFASQTEAVAAGAPLAAHTIDGDVRFRYERVGEAVSVSVDPDARPASWPEYAWKRLDATETDHRDSPHAPTSTPSQRAMKRGGVGASEPTSNAGAMIKPDATSAPAPRIELPTGKRMRITLPVSAPPRP